MIALEKKIITPLTACVEAVAASILTFWLALSYERFEHIYIGFLFAPLLLMRTPASQRLGLKIFKIAAFLFKPGEIIPKIALASCISPVVLFILDRALVLLLSIHITTVAGYYIPGLEFMLSAQPSNGLLYLAFFYSYLTIICCIMISFMYVIVACSIVFLIRLGSTLYIVLSKPLYSAWHIPINYRKVMLQDHILAAPEIIPGASRDSELSGFSIYHFLNWNIGQMIQNTDDMDLLKSKAMGDDLRIMLVHFLIIIMTMVIGTLVIFILTVLFYAPSLTYKVLLKSTFIFYMPFLLVSTLSSKKKSLERIMADILEDRTSRLGAITLIASHLAIPVAYAFVMTKYGGDNLLLQLKPSLDLLVPLVSFVHKNTIRLDGIAKLVSAITVFALFAVAKILCRRTYILSVSTRKMIYKGINAVIILRAILVAYATFYMAIMLMKIVEPQEISNFLYFFWVYLRSMRIDTNLVPS